ncbi:MAG: hypothetical protein J5694_01580 [Erysipelotrichaceae bacterium]|nr:hypothetical protein [Erysipelotrichaceae bacterium]MBO4537542.1 hypothetical protein [Erysipelotrichaceae bacterium]
MNNEKIYESIGSSTSDDWMERERRYEARHSPWDLDDNASYLDEEHRKHCEAREVRRKHEESCEVEHPDYQEYQKTANRPAASQWQTLKMPEKAELPAFDEKVAKWIAFIVFILMVFFVNIFMN